MSQPPKIYVAGHRGAVGSAIVRQLLAEGHPAECIVTRMLEQSPERVMSYFQDPRIKYAAG